VANRDRSGNYYRINPFRSTITVPLLLNESGSGTGMESVDETEAKGSEDEEGPGRMRRKKKGGGSSQRGSNSAGTSADSAANLDLSLVGVETEVVPNP
jgi:hypothetical protein